MVETDCSNIKLSKAVVGDGTAAGILGKLSFCSRHQTVLTVLPPTKLNQKLITPLNVQISIGNIFKCVRSSLR